MAVNPNLAWNPSEMTLNDWMVATGRTYANGQPLSSLEAHNRVWKDGHAEIRWGTHKEDLAAWLEGREAEAAEDRRQADQFIFHLRNLMPWIDTIGIDPSWFQENAAEASGPDELLARLRATPQYKARFPSLRRPDGSLRMNEAQYLQREQDFRDLLRQYGYEMEDYQTPQSMSGFFDAEFSPDEFEQRLSTFDQIKRSSQTTKDAFYVYAGLDVTDSDLYEAIVDPAAKQRLSDRYNEAVAATPFDYELWITRATERGLQRVADQLGQMERDGIVANKAVQRVLQTDPGFARQMMDAIYTGGTGNISTGTMSLNDLLAAFDYAVIGAAASEAGLSLPTKERLAEIRTAGVERRQAIEAYTSYGQVAGFLRGASLRAGYGGLTQDEFERGRFLGDRDSRRELQMAAAYEEAAGRDRGEFRFSEERGRLVQRGFGVRP